MIRRRLEFNPFVARRSLLQAFLHSQGQNRKSAIARDTSAHRLQNRRPCVIVAGSGKRARASRARGNTEGLRAHAESIASEVEPELSLAVDAVLPEDP